MTKIEFHGKDKYGDEIWTATGGNISVIRSSRSDIEAILETGDRSIGCAPAMEDWPAAYIAAKQVRLGL